MGIDRVDAAPAQFHPADRDALQDAERADLRQRRVRGRHGQGARARRLERLRQAPRRVARETASCAASGCAASSKSRAASSNEKADLRFEADGKVAIRLGVQAMGQGHLSTLPRIVAKRLGIEPSAVRLIEGDSDEVPDGTPSVASRSLMMAGSATAIACDEAIEKGRRIAAHCSRSPPATSSSPTARSRSPAPTARCRSSNWRSARARSEPAGRSERRARQRRRSSSRRRCRFRTAATSARSRSIPQTGVVAVVGYVAVDDVGNIIHEAIVDGQIHGGIAQGLGQVLGEQVVYGEDGQLLTASFMDYVMPRADDVRMSLHHAVPCTTNPLGVKGAGESGVAAAFGVSAVLDALSLVGVTISTSTMLTGILFCSPRQAKGRRNVACATDLPVGPASPLWSGKVLVGS